MLLRVSKRGFFVEGDVGIYEHLVLLHRLPFVDGVCLQLSTLLADVSVGPRPRDSGVHRLLLIVSPRNSVFIFQERLRGDKGVSATDLMSGRLWRVDRLKEVVCLAQGLLLFLN